MRPLSSMKRPKVGVVIERTEWKLPDTTPELWRDGRSVWCRPEVSEAMWSSPSAVNLSIVGRLHITMPQTTGIAWTNFYYSGAYLKADEYELCSGSFEHVQRQFERVLDFMRGAS